MDIRRALIVASLALAAACRIGSPKPPVITPPTPVEVTVPVSLFEGNPSDDHKVPGAAVRIDGCQAAGCTATSDGSGNAFLRLLPGSYTVCAVADGYQEACGPVSAPGAANLVLKPAVKPVLPLRADGRIFREVTGTDDVAWRWMGVSAFQLLDRFSKGEDISGFLEDYKGFNILRVWAYTPRKDWGDRAWDAPSVEQTKAFLAYTAARGWRVELTLLTDDAPDKLAWAQAFLGQLAADPRPVNLLIEAGNEPQTHKDIRTGDLIPAMQAAGFPYATGDYENASLMKGLYGVAHTSRDSEWPRRAHDLLEFYSGGGPNNPSDPPHRFPIIADEPAKLQDVGGDRPKDWRAYFATCALLGGGATFHSETGKFGQRPTGDEKQLIQEALMALTAFPADAPLGTYRRIDESGRSLRTYIVGERFMVRIRPQTTAAPEAGWTPIDADGILFRK